MIIKPTIAELAEHLGQLGFTIPKDGYMNPQQPISIRAQERTGSDLLSWIIHIDPSIDGFTTKGCLSSLLVVPEIQHVRDKNIDTKAVEHSLASINWQYVLPGQIKESHQIMQPILQLFSMASSGNDQLRSISDQLTLKYLTGTPVESLLMPIPERYAQEHHMFTEWQGKETDLSRKDIIAKLENQAGIKKDARQEKIKEQKADQKPKRKAFRL